MKQFQTFLSEAAASEDKLKHLEHAEDHPINAGAEGYLLKPFTAEVLVKKINAITK